MDMQVLTFFTEGNTFTGSRTKDWETRTMLRYLVRPDKETGELEVFSWTQDLCFDCALDKKGARFNMNEDGLEKIQAWLSERYAEI